MKQNRGCISDPEITCKIICPPCPLTPSILQLAFPESCDQHEPHQRLGMLLTVMSMERIASGDDPCRPGCSGALRLRTTGALDVCGRLWG